MIILTNCLTETVDEGCLKVANSLIPRIKRTDPNVTVVSYGRKSPDCDVHIPANKLMFSPRLASYLHKRDEPILYIPAYARMLPTTFRMGMLSLFTKRDIWVLLTMKSRISRISRFLMRASGVRIIALADESWQIYRALIGDKARLLKTGVDSKRYVPVSEECKKALRQKYGVPIDKPIVLHVGHMKEGRNVAQLASIDEAFHVVLVVSTLTKAEQDEQVCRKLEERPNVTIFDSYFPQIEEIYQMADVYLFPVIDESSCIDVPLSALEAAACGLPVVTTPYGELKQLIDKEGFYQLESLQPEYVNDLLRRAVSERKSARSSVLPYDWDMSVAQLLQEMNSNAQS